MSNIERMTITMPSEMAAIIKTAVDEGDYASTSEVVREALREWKLKRKVRTEAFIALQNDINEGIADYKAGRVTDFNMDRIIANGRRLLAEN